MLKLQLDPLLLLDQLQPVVLIYLSEVQQVRFHFKNTFFLSYFYLDLLDFH